MAELKRAVLFGKLDSFAYKALESATIFCRMRGNPYVELAHWVHQMLQTPDADIGKIFARFQVDAARFAADLTAALDRLPRGATSISDFSPHLEEAAERGWVYASLLFNAAEVRSGHLVVGILRTPGLREVFLAVSKELGKIKADTLADDFEKIVQGSCETGLKAEGAGGSESAGGGLAPAPMGKQEALARFSIDLTDKARKGELDPISGRDEEIRQIIDILMRRRQNNPILAGEAGVGKTAVVEGFALRIVSGDVPPALKDVTLRTLDLGLLQAGAGVKGEFENRLRQVIEEVQASPSPIILFIDEAHTLIGAGGAAGTGDAANLLKPALARGALRTIGATTWAEYRKYFEKDPALTRRFQVIKVNEPSEDVAVTMIRGLAPELEKHHKVAVLDEALEAAARLSHRYIPSRQLPDKAVSLIDTACARVAVSQHSTPAQVEDSTRRIAALTAETEAVKREARLGMDHTERLAGLAKELEAERIRNSELEAAWKKEKEMVGQILTLRAKLRDAPEGEPGNDAALKELRGVEAELAKVQGENPLVYPAVDAQAVAGVLSDWTGIPAGRMMKDEIQAVLKLADTLEKRIIGQRHALEAISRRIETSRARLDNPGKPIGVFLLAGTSGVGKTETALALAEALYGGESNVITINMSEFQEAHTVSTLKGAPPGYVGYGEGGVLTEAVRHRPYSLVLLDEVEKAHTDVHEIFFQVFDKGWMEDGEGRFIDFKNTIILLTTNVGSDLIMNLCKDPDMIPDPEGIAKALRPALLKAFPAALLGRLVVVPYYPLTETMLKNIIRLQLGRIVRRVAENHDIALTYGEDVVELIAGRCNEIESGGRVVDAILTQTLLPEISHELLGRMMDGAPVTRVSVVAEEGKFRYTFE